MVKVFEGDGWGQIISFHRVVEEGAQHTTAGYSHSPEERTKEPVARLLVAVSQNALNRFPVEGNIMLGLHEKSVKGDLAAASKFLEAALNAKKDSDVEGETPRSKIHYLTSGVYAYRRNFGSALQHIMEEDHEFEYPLDRVISTSCVVEMETFPFDLPR